MGKVSLERAVEQKGEYWLSGSIWGWWGQEAGISWAGAKVMKRTNEKL